MHRTGWIVLSAMLLAGCSNGDSAQDSAATTEPAPAAAEVPRETVFDPLVGTMDRAKSVEATSAGRMDELNQQLEDAE